MTKKPVISTTVGQSATKYVKPTAVKPTTVNSGKSADKALKKIVDKAPVVILPAAAAAGALYGVKKLADKYDKSKNAKKIKDKAYIWSHGNWSR
jgi:hypothetical protein